MKFKSKIMKALSVATLLLSANSGFAYEYDFGNDGDIPNGKVLGYTLKGCYSYDNEDYMNYCKKSNEKQFKKVLDKAKAMKEPNFNKDKKLIQLFYNYKNEYRSDDGKLIKINIPLADTFVVDEKNKTVYLYAYYANYMPDYINKNKKAPEVMTNEGKNSDWFCLFQNGAVFRESYIEGYVASNTEVSEDSKYLCVHFSPKISKDEKHFSSPINLNNLKELKEMGN